MPKLKSLTIKEETNSYFPSKNIIEESSVNPKFEKLYSYLNNLDTKTIPLISIILPLYNEEKTIKTILENLPHHHLIEIIVVDDHSEDNSLKEIRQANLPRKIKIIKHNQNMGYGGALLTGIKNAMGKIIVTMDSDGQHSSDDIFNLVKPIVEGDADLSIGSRYLGKYFYKLPITTRFGESLLEKLLQILFNIKIKNNQNGFRAFDRKINYLFTNMNYYGYAFCTELIIKTKLEGYRIKECPIKVYDRKYGTSNIILRKLALRISTCIFQYFLIKHLPLNKNNEDLFIFKVLKKILSYI
ncbi:MAG: glycosyltransferase family 2 protein [Promethearchaeota archaeon]|nr:MAG: glycosyltransferase family 2 protein [Candidatus Lokiarchaeota archaeon]